MQFFKYISFIFTIWRHRKLNNFVNFQKSFANLVWLQRFFYNFYIWSLFKIKNFVDLKWQNMTFFKFCQFSRLFLKIPIFPDFCHIFSFAWLFFISWSFGNPANSNCFIKLLRKVIKFTLKTLFVSEKKLVYGYKV